MKKGDTHAMSAPKPKRTTYRNTVSPKPFRHLVMLLDYREPGHVLVDLKPITLKPLAWKLLMGLAESPGIVIPYADLYEQLWGDTIVEANQLSYQKNAIMTAIRNVAPDREEIIRTFNKIGFMLDLSPREVLIVPTQPVNFSSLPIRHAR